MDRNFLYGVIAVLGISLGLLYTQKKNPDFFTSLTGNKKQVDAWQKEDPGWSKDFPKADSPVAPPIMEPLPKAETPPVEPQPQPQPKTQPRRFQRQPECPPNG